MFYYFDPTTILLLPAILLALIAQVRVGSTFNHYRNVPARSGLTGAEMARQLLESEGINNVAIERVSGQLTDHYDPRTLTLRLSESTFDSASVAALGVAAHEAGHALQHRDEYAPLILRNIAVPTVNFGSMLSWPLFVAGLIFSWQPLLYAGIALFALTVLFSVSSI